MNDKIINQTIAEGLEKGSAIDFQHSFEQKLKTVLERKLNEITNSDRNVSLELEVASKSFGGEPQGSVNGVVSVMFRTRQGALHYADWLEEQPTVEYYEIDAEFKDRVASQTVDVVDIDRIMDDAPFNFTVTAYIYPEFVQFTHDYDQDGDEDAGDEAMEIEAESADPLAEFELEELELFLEDEGEFLDEVSKALLGRYIKKAGQHRVNLAKAERDLDDKDSALQKAKHGADNDTYDALSKAQDKMRQQRYKIGDKSMQRAQGISKAISRLTKESIEAFEQIDEVERKVRVNARGLKSIKMKCPSGFKWDPSIQACMKITGAELATMRKASRHAIITKKSEGQALKVRVKRRIRRAFKFREMMGLPV